VCVRARARLCLEYRPHSRIASPEFNLLDVRYKNSEAECKAKSLFYIQKCVSNVWNKEPVRM